MALGPTCPCDHAAGQPLIKKVEPPAADQAGRHDPAEAQEAAVYDDDDVVVERGPPGPPPDYVPPGAYMGGVGIGMGGYGGGYGGGMRGGMGGGYGGRR